MDLQAIGTWAPAIHLGAGAAAIWVARRDQRAAEDRPYAFPDTSDPFLVAYLRGGAYHATRIATYTLLKRGLLKGATGKLERIDRADTGAMHTLERRVYEHFDVSRDAYTVLKAVDPATRPLGLRLTYAGLLPDVAANRARRWRIVGILAVAWLPALAAYVMAPRSAAWLLMVVVAAALSTVGLWALGRHRTAAGDRAFLGIRALLEPGRSKAARGLLSVPELALSAAAFGMAAIASDLPLLTSAFPKANGSDGGCGGCGGGCGCGGCGA